LATATQIEASTTGQPLSGFEPEFELLLACCSEISGTLSVLDQILASPLHWDSVLKLAEYHRLLPPLYASLCERDDVPASIGSAIRARFQKHVHRVLRFSAELARILRHFGDLGIQVLAHKGPALAQLLYGDPAMRQFGDLDFLIRARDVSRARTAVGELGYEPRLNLLPRQEKAYLQSGYEYVFGLGSERNLVELQWQIAPRFYAIDFDMEGLFQRSVDLQLEGVRAPTLGNEDLILSLCVHAAKHQWTQAAMLRDIAACVRRRPDWRWIEGEARRLGILNILMISLLLARNLFQCELPELLKKHFDTKNAEKLCSAIQSRLTDGLELQPDTLRYVRAMLRLRERWQDRMRFVCRLATTPSVGEWGTSELPDSFFFLYRGVRLYRLLKRPFSNREKRNGGLCPE
jgi:hypothetical protein